MKSTLTHPQVNKKGADLVLPLDVIEARLRQHYKAQGLSDSHFKNCWAVVRHLNVHPQLATLSDVEKVVLRVEKSSSRRYYATILKIVFQYMNKLRLIDNDPTVDLTRPRVARALPKPLTDKEAMFLMANAASPMREWIILGCMAGLRAMEIANLRGDDLSLTDDGHILEVRGKGGTVLTVPAHPLVVGVIQSAKTLGRLWDVTPIRVTQRAADEMRRLGVDRTLHCARHYFATSALKASGGDLLVVRDLMRHTSVATTQVYTQLAVERPRAIVDLLPTPPSAIAI